MLCCLGPLQVGHKSMNTWSETWWRTVEAKSLAVAQIFFHLDYICDALWILLLVNLCKEYLQICPFFITSAVFCGLLGISFWAKSWWMVICFCWPLSLDGLTSLLPCDMVKMHHVIFTMTWYIQRQSSPNCCCMSCLLFVSFFVLFFSMVNPYKVSWQTGRSQDLDQESMPSNFKLQ